MKVKIAGDNPTLWTVICKVLTTDCPGERQSKRWAARLDEPCQLRRQLFRIRENIWAIVRGFDILTQDSHHQHSCATSPAIALARNKVYRRGELKAAIIHSLYRGLQLE
jgi:hypothetical protein